MLMVVSMTGYGRGSSEGENILVHAEMKTVNHRFCEFHIRMPRQLLVLEDKIKKLLAGYIRRGRVEVFLTVEGQGLIHKKVNVDWDLLDQYMAQMDTIAKKYHLHPPSSPHKLADLDGVFIVEEEQARSAEIEAYIMEAVRQAALELKEMRIQEGSQLKKDIENQLERLRDSADKVKQYAPLVLEQYREKLKSKVKDFDTGAMDETRLMNEVALFADRADINEEITRLNSHIHQTAKTLDSNEAMGRKLDFLVQEMNREVNTIGSKANDARIAGEVVEMKSLLEKIKEQIQNIE